MAKQMIIQTAENQFETKSGSTSLILKKSKYGHWEVWADNAAVRAYRTLGIKTFADLKQVEERYKAFKGIVSLIESNTAMV